MSVNIDATLLLFYSLQVFHTSVSWWSFTRIWVSSGLQDSSQYSGQSQQCCSLNCLDSSSDFQLFQFPFQSFGDSSKHTKYNWYHHHPPVPQFLLVLRQGLSICLSFHFLLFSLCGLLEWKIHYMTSSFFFFSFLLALGLVYGPELGNILYLIIPENFMHLII